MLTEFNEGGRHEENPYGGIPQGSSSNGQMNTVEQGETKKGNFVYSDRLYINEDLAKQMNLPSYIKGKTFANASKSINDKFKGRNDIHTKATQKELLDRLANAQEYLKQQEAQINESMQSNMQTPEFGNQFKGGGLLGLDFSTQDDLLNSGNTPITNGTFSNNKFFNFLKNNNNTIGSVGDFLSTSNIYDKQINKANSAGFEDNKAFKDNLNSRVLNSAMDGVASAFGPVGTAARGLQKLGKGIGDSIGGDGGAIVSGIFSPQEGALSAFTDKKANIGEKALSMIPGVGNLLSNKRADKRLSDYKDNKLRVDNFFKYKFNENTNPTKVFKKGGFLPFSTEKDDPNYVPNYDDDKWLAGKNAYDFITEVNNRNKINQSELDYELQNNPDFASPDINFNKIESSKPMLNTEISKQKNKINFNKLMNGLSDAQRYAPILGNMLQKASIGPAEVDEAIKNKYQYQRQLMDTKALENIASQEAYNTNQVLAQSGLTGNQLLSAMMGSQLNRTKAISDAYQQVNQHNINENKLAEQVKQQNESDYINDSRYVRETNAQNRANRDTQISKFNSEIYNSLGEIGKEKTYEKMAEKLTGYNKHGEFLSNNPEYKSQFDEIDNDKKLTLAEKYAKKSLIAKGYKGPTEEDIAKEVQQQNLLMTYGHKAYGGYISPKFKKY